MKITYDLETLPERKSNGKKSEEVLAIQAFLACSQKNMCIEYDDESTVKRRYDAIRNWRRTNGLQAIFDLYRVKKCIYIVNLKRNEKKGRCS